MRHPRRCFEHRGRPDADSARRVGALRFEFRTNFSGATPSSGSVFFGGHLGDDRQTQSPRMARIAALIRSGRGLFEDEEIEAAIEQLPAPARGSRPPLRRRRSAPRLSIRMPSGRLHCDISLFARRIAGRSARPLVDRLDLVGQRKGAMLDAIRREGVLSMTSAPARTYPWCTSRTRSGWVRLSSSNSG